MLFLLFINNKADVYYVNYCTLEDFKYMEEKKYNLSNSIVLCRYGNKQRLIWIIIIPLVFLLFFFKAKYSEVTKWN